MSNELDTKDILIEEETVFDLSASCTKDQAVMRILGWGQGSVFKLAIPITEDGISPEDLRQMHPEAMTLSERLQDMAEHARNALILGAENGTSQEELGRLDDEVEKVRQLAARARELRMDIEDELSKGENSILRIDDDATNSSGVTHINIRSLEKWIAEPDSSEAPNAKKSRPRQKLREQEEAISRVIEELGHSPKSLPHQEPGKKGVKSAVNSKLADDPLFKDKRTSFNKAWERLRKDGSIADSA